MEKENKINENGIIVVKEESIETFLKGYLGFIDCNNRSCCTDFQYRMVDEIIFPKNKRLEIGKFVELHFIVRSTLKGIDIEYVYLYKISSFDDVSDKMIIEDFTIRRIEKK